MKTQNQMVLEHLKTHKSINLVTAFYEYGIAALHSRISDLRQDGHEIEKVYHLHVNQHGKKIRVFDYILVREAE